MRNQTTKTVIRIFGFVVTINVVFAAGWMCGWNANQPRFAHQPEVRDAQGPASSFPVPRVMSSEELHDIIDEWERYWGLEPDHGTPERVHGGVI